jgi:tetratricopeptide (TPR) repeat protein
MLKGSYDKGRDYFYKAFQMNPSNRKPIGGILFTMVLEKLDDFKSDKAKEVASKFVDMMVKRLNKADEAYDYLIVAKVLYRLDRDAESLKYINDGLKAFAGDPMLNFAKAIVLTKENNFNDAKKILDGITANLDDTNKKEAEKLQMYIAGK